MLVSLMGSSILSEGCQHLDSQEGALQCYYDPLNRLPVSRLLLPLSGLERSDFVRWPYSDLRCNQRLRLLLEDKRTRYARREIFRVWPTAAENCAAASRQLSVIRRPWC